MKVLVTPNSRRQAKKLRKNQFVDLKKGAIDIVAGNPKEGTQKKKGLLFDIYVNKFRMNKQVTLLAYKVESHAIILYSVGYHENF